MSSLAMQKVGPASCKGPIVYRPDTRCTVQLGAGLMPVSLSHTKRCKCIPVGTDEELGRLVDSVKDAMKMNIMDFEKPSAAFAMILLGADVVYSDVAG
ncbi:hypothetical protein F4781DRAFT_381446, partial [Annulohypoxylon bovei var. microspora]